MTFIEPVILWGALAVAIPVAIHFWHQRQGKLLPWAATQWLTEQQNQQSRGLRLDNIPLLLVRCLLLCLLAILLAQPVLNWFAQEPAIQQVHLVQPNVAITANFRFELEEALRKGDRVVWANERLEKVTDQLTLPKESTPFNPLLLQTAIHRLDSRNTELHAYIVNNQALASVPVIAVPKRFKLHTIADSTAPARTYLSVQDGKKLFVNQAGKLTANRTLDPTLRFASTPAHSGTLYTLVDYRNDRERQTVKAALSALSEVYSLDLTLDEKAILDRQYTWVLTDQYPVKPLPQTLYIVSGVAQPSGPANVIYTNETLTPQTSERVENGQLPEWLGEQFVQHYQLEPSVQPLSQQGLKALFIPTAKPSAQQQAGIQNGLLLIFVVLLLVERWLALTKNA